MSDTIQDRLRSERPHMFGAYSSDIEQEAADYIDTLEARVEEWKQAAQAEANCKRSARADALEEAAKVVDTKDKPGTVCRDTFTKMAQTIRALKEQSGE